MKLLYSVILITILACKNEPPTAESPASILRDLIPPPITENQEAALDAWNQLQTRTNNVGQLYSTFAKLDHPFFPADSTFEVRQSEMLIYLNNFTEQHGRASEVQYFDELITSAVLAEAKYTVIHCQGDLEVGYANGIPMSGIWVLWDVCGSRDIVLRWD